MGREESNMVVAWSRSWVVIMDGGWWWWVEVVCFCCFSAKPCIVLKTPFIEACQVSSEEGTLKT